MMDGLMRVDGVIQPVNGVAFAIDIGGSLAKVAYFTVARTRTSSMQAEDAAISDRSHSVEPEEKPSPGESGRLHLGYFETTKIESCIRFIRERMEQGDSEDPCVVRATGGGAHKYMDLFAKENLLFHKLGEMECLVHGCNYVLRYVQDEAFTFTTNDPPRHFVKNPAEFPYILVNIGSGVSIIKVEGEDKYERVDGSAVGGGTFLGLATLLTRVHSFSDMLQKAAEGDCRHVDMLVKDIYGESTPPSLGLNPDITASCFGKAKRKAQQQTATEPAAITDHDSVDGHAIATTTAPNHSHDGDDALSPSPPASSKSIGPEHQDSGSSERAQQHSSSPATPRTALQAEHAVPDSEQMDGPFSEKDLLASLLQMVCFNIAQVACLNARLHNTTTVVFAGFFIRNHERVMAMITQAVTYWGHGKIRALFLRHEGYLGAIGSFLGGISSESKESSRASPIPETHSVSEQYISRHSAKEAAFLHESFQFDLRLHESSLAFPLLAGTYHPDTIDLMKDTPARTYWLQRFKDNSNRECVRAKKIRRSTHESEESVATRANAFLSTFLKHMEILTVDPSAYGELSVRSILELRQQCLTEFGFTDIYEEEKATENEAALQYLPSLLQQLDTLSPEDEARETVCGVLAGNCFDWGAAEIAKEMDAGAIDFLDQKEKVHGRNWLRNDLVQFVSHLKANAFAKALIFADNAGPDILLGIIPFARMLLKQKCSVVIAANSLPVLNDVTFPELVALLESVSAIDATIAAAMQEGRLLCVPNGSGSPCIDLDRIGLPLARAAHDVDLIVLEGMGRAVHTNYDATFSCASLKLAMIKNSWLAEKLGGKVFDVVCRFDDAHQ